MQAQFNLYTIMEQARNNGKNQQERGTQLYDNTQLHSHYRVIHTVLLEYDNNISVFK